MLAAIGGVSLRRWYYGPELFWRARQALLQARGDPLCLQADVFAHQGLYFSLSVWEDVEAMLTFAQSGPHRRVAEAASRLATVNEFHHFPCIAVPNRDQALRVWAQRVQDER
ncbi:hypothetical protein [Ruegeria conchae]|uniref:hypothetical protein n=1 Tax=Ruegeria conchae TaxID=981384 RepID=UPI0029C99B45|nr:hypothetical protein [Ruegeria conchae]